MCIYVAVGPFETVYNTKCTESAAIGHKTLEISGYQS